MSSSPTGLGDVLGAASLLLAILAVLYSIWYSDLAAALRVEIPTHLEDAEPQRRTVDEALRARATPLLVAGLVLLLVFVPEAVRLITHWLEHAWRYGLWHAVTSYDPVRLSIVVVVVFLLLLTFYAIWLTVELLKLKKRLRVTL